MADETPQVEPVPNMPSDGEMFRQSTAPETPPPPKPEPPPPQQGYSDDPQPLRAPIRDEHGRFTGAYQEPDDDKQPPPHRWKEMREERDSLAERNRQWEFAYYDLLQKQRNFEAQQQEAAQKQQAPPIPDPVVDPQGWNNYINNTIADNNRRLEQNFSFRLAHERHGEAFQHAYGEMISRAQQGDPSIVRSVMQSPDPGAAMMSWYITARNQAMMGQYDPPTWAKEVWFRESLKDPQFQGWALEQLRASQPSPQPQPYGSPAVQLPPSLSRLPAAAPVGATNGDLSDASLFDFAMRQGRPRR